MSPTYTQNLVESPVLHLSRAAAEALQQSARLPSATIRGLCHGGLNGQA